MRWFLAVLLILVSAAILYVTVAMCNMEWGRAPESYGESRLAETRTRFLHPVDIVFTWVDGHDDERNALRERVKYMVKNGGEPPEADAIRGGRFHNFNELRYAIRSVEMYAPWIRTIYILASGGQVPDFLSIDTLSPVGTKVEMVYEEDLRGQIIEGDDVPPTFNSHAIECAMHRIPGLSERFLYSCDDMFFTRPVEPEFFFPEDDTFRLYRHALITTSRADPNSNVDMHFKAWSNNNRLLDRLCGKKTRLYPSHQITAMTVSAMRTAEQVFHEDWSETETHPFRHHTDVHPFGLAQYLAVHNGKAEWSTGEPFYYAPIMDNRTMNDVVFASMFLHGSDLKCMNDHSSHTDPKVDAQVRNVLEKMFPKKSHFESS